MINKRPKGIWIFAAWYILLSLWGIYVAIFNILRVGKIYDSPQNLLMTIRDPIVYIVLPVIYLISAIGILRRNNWSRLLFICSSIISLMNLLFIFFVAFLPSGSHIFMGFARYSYIVGYAIAIFLPHLGAILYFINPKVKIQFRSSS